MSASDDLQQMIDILAIAIAREEFEGRFFRRSSRACKNEVACKMFDEIAIAKAWNQGKKCLWQLWKI